MADEFMIDDLLCHEASIKIQKGDEVWRASRVVSTWKSGASGMSEKGKEAPRTFPHTSPSGSLPSGHFELYLFITKPAI